MLETLTPYAQHAGLWLAWALVVLLGAAGVLVSCLGISGTWMLVGAAAIAAPLTGPDFPGWGLVVVFAVMAAAVDGVEWFASHWGVRRRGGSRLAGLAAMVGGLLGLFAGSFVFPVIGSVIGMMAGSFALAYAVERRRLQAGHAAHIATGAVVACVLVLMLKVVVSLTMAAWLAVGILS